MRDNKRLFTICVLLYGNHFDLAKRCLGSLLKTCPSGVFPEQVRIGLNEPCSETEHYVIDLIQRRLLFEDQVYFSRENIHKYPMMRRMFYERRITTPYTMWFDDDSYVKDGAYTPGSNFLDTVQAIMEPAPDTRRASSAMCGSIYTQSLVGNQTEWIQNQPWYAGAVQNPVRFATGGWWTIRTELLYKFNYPWPELDHRGGDVMLGQLMHQQKLHLASFKHGLAINADSRGRESKAKKRGFDQRPVGFDYKRTQPAEIEPARTPEATQPRTRLYEVLDL